MSDKMTKKQLKATRRRLMWLTRKRTGWTPPKDTVVYLRNIPNGIGSHLSERQDDN